MTTQFFTNYATVADIKITYRKLAMIHHPDRGGDTATMQELNAQYRAALRRCDGQVSMGDDKREHTYAYDPEIEQAIIEFIDRLMKTEILSDKVEVNIIGTWVWITGETYPIRKKLGKDGIGCTWHSKRECWYFTPEQRKTFYSRKGFDQLAAQYGRVTVGRQQDTAMVAA